MFVNFNDALLYGFYNIVGIDIDIKFMPNNCTEHIKESMSEDRCDYIEELSLKSLPPPQTLKVL